MKSWRSGMSYEDHQDIHTVITPNKLMVTTVSSTDKICSEYNWIIVDNGGKHHRPSV